MVLGHAAHQILNFLPQVFETVATITEGVSNGGPLASSILLSRLASDLLDGSEIVLR